MDDDPPAAMRYTEARMARITGEVLADLEKDTVDFQLNFDDTLKEPTVMPSKVPNLLINGASGIAVGMATNILPHNLSEVIDGIVAYRRRLRGSRSRLRVLRHFLGSVSECGGCRYHFVTTNLQWPGAPRSGSRQNRF